MTWSVAIWSAWALSLLAAAQDASPPAFATNTSTYVPNSNATEQLVLGLLTMPGATPNDYNIFALTDAAQSLASMGAGTPTGVDGHLWNTNASTFGNISVPDQAVAYVSCDADDYQTNINLSEVLDGAINVQVDAVLFYSKYENFCLLSPNLSSSENAFARFYTMTAPLDSIAVLNSLTAPSSGNSTKAALMTQATYSNNINAANSANGIDNTPSTAVAMIILYSITGVITALFLVIIVTGAVRAHRHPERYGPQNVLGRVRQSRAKGIARAMLDTIPIVKFGQQPPGKQGDIELAAGPSNRASTVDEHNATPAQTDKNAPAEESGADGDVTASGAQAAVASTTSPEHSHDTDNGISCSICTEDFEQGQDIRVLPCNHKFHPACVDPWLLDVSGTCPLCRVDLRPQEERRSTDGTEAAPGSGQSGEGAPLPPPLQAGRSRRRDTILNFLDRRRMQDSNSEERISALRRWRQLNRRSRASAPAPDADDGTTTTPATSSENPEQR